MKEIDQVFLSDIVMFYGALNVRLSRRPLKVNYSKLTTMRSIEHTVSLFFTDVFKITIFHQIISAHKVIHTIFGSGIYHNPHFILKYKSQEFNNKNIGVFSESDTRMAGYFVGMHRDLRMTKFLQSTISSA